MNIIKYLCNLKQSYLVLIMTSTINRIIKLVPSINDTGNFYTAFWVDGDKGFGMIKIIYLNTTLKWGAHLFGITELNVFLTGATFSPLNFVYKYNEMG